jgi:hypothetical protein
MDKKLLNEIKRIKQLMNINENEVNESMKDLMKAALLCTVLATGEMSCKRPEEILPSEKSSDLTRNVDSNYSQLPKKYFNLKDVKEVKIPEDSVEEASRYNPNMPWVGIWKMTFPWRVKNKEYFIWSSNGSDDIRDSKFYKVGYISDVHKAIIEYKIQSINIEKNDDGYIIYMEYKYTNIPDLQGTYNITFLLFNNNQELKVVNWGDAGYAIRMDHIPYR